MGDRDDDSRLYRDATRDIGATVNAFRGMAEAREPWRLADRLDQLRCPVHVLVGGAEHRGGIDPDGITALRSAIPTATIETVPGAGHFIFEENPRVVIAAILRVAEADHATVALDAPDR